MKIAMLGGGSWGTAVARLLSNRNHDVVLYVRNTVVAKNILQYHENTKFLPGCFLPQLLKVVTELFDAVNHADVVILGIPSDAVRSVLEAIKNKIRSDVVLVNLAKGIEVDTLMRMSEVASEVLPNNPYVCISGPSHAEEVGKDIPTAVVASSTDAYYAQLIQKEFMTDTFRIYTNDDLLGVEMGGALKNIIALAAGLSDGLGYGDNSKAALMTRGIYEIAKLGMEMGAKPHTFNGLSGIGDLIVTCTSMHSRNRRAGILIGQGNTTQQACQKVGQVVEGIKTTKSAYLLANKYHIEMPITAKLYEVLYCGKDPRVAVDVLMTRKEKEEIQQIFLVKGVF